MAARICIEPGCPQPAVGDSRCPEHQREARRRLDAARPNPRARGYDRDHEAWRADVLARHPICTACGAAPATEADHITPISHGGSRLDPANGTGLCKSCHSRKTARQGRWG